MQIKPRKSLLRLAPAAAGFTLAGILPLLVAAQAQALEFSFAEEEVTGSLNSTASYGQLWRVKSQSGHNDDINGNDGNRNFDTGLVSQVFKLTSELTMQYQNYGAFMRGTALYDTELMNHNSDYYSNNDPSQPSQSYPNDSHFGDDAQDISGQDAKLLDAYLWADWDVANMPLNVKAGKQVFNWGEALFVRDGINTSNPVDAAAFRLPGSEIKEVLIPTEALGFNLGVTEDLSVEGYYQWKWTETVQDPVGTYYSTDDLFSPGGNYAYSNLADTPLGQPIFGPGSGSPTLVDLYSLGFGSSIGGNGNTFIYPENTPGNQIARVATIGDDIEARDGGQWGMNFKYVVEELNSTEFGLYFINYHTKEPNINADVNGYTPSIGIFDPSNGLVSGLATIDLLGGVNAQREYVEDVRMYGFSFSTTVGENSFFGELAYRPNMPIGISTSDDMLNDLIGQAVVGFNDGTPTGVGLAYGGSATIGGQTVNYGDSYSNYTRVEMYNYSLGSIQNWGPALGFNSVFSVAEVAGVSYRGDDLQYTAYDGSNRYFSSASNAEYINEDNGRDDQINRNAYSYTLVAQGTWNDVFSGVNVSPSVAWNHNFEGNSHQAGSYVEGDKAYTLGLDASYQNTLEAGISYTDFVDSGLDDRDVVGVNVKYSF